MRVLVLLAIVGVANYRAIAQSADQSQAPTAPPVAEAPSLKTTPAESAVVIRTAAEILALRIPEFRLEDVPLELVIDWLRKMCDTNVLVRWERLAEAGVARDKSIQLHGRNMTLRTILDLLIRAAAEEDAPLAYRVSDNLILITTKADLDERLITRTYDVSDVILPEQTGGQMFIGRARDIPIGTTPVVAAGAVGQRPIVQTWSSGNFLEGYGVGPWRDRGEGQRSQERERLLRELVEAIIATVEPDTWDVNGGRGSIRIFKETLIIRNTPLVHEKIAQHP